MTIFAIAIGRCFGHTGIKLGLTWTENGLLDVKTIAYDLIVIQEGVVEATWVDEVKLKQLRSKC